MTVNDLGVAVLSDLGIYGAGETPSAEDMALFLARLNDWIDALKTDSLSVYTVTRSVWTIVANTTSYTVGTGGTVAIDRPLNPQRIENIGYQATSPTPTEEFLFGKCLSEQEYDCIPIKGLTSPYPTAWYYNPTYPLGALKPWPVPTSSGLQGVIYSQTPVSEFTDLTSLIALPPGYRRFLRSNMAVEVAGAFRAQPDQSIMKAAAESMAQVKRTNERLQEMSVGGAARIFGYGSYYDIYAG